MLPEGGKKVGCAVSSVTIDIEFDAVVGSRGEVELETSEVEFVYASRRLGLRASVRRVYLSSAFVQWLNNLYHATLNPSTNNKNSQNVLNNPS